METLTIGQIAQRAGVGVETVRFYERQGLLDEPDRTRSGYRQYEEAVVDRLRFIRRAKDLGFTLKEIKELLQLRVDPMTSCVEVKRRAEAKLEDIESKILALRRMKGSLLKLTKACGGRGRAAECSILNHLKYDGRD